MRKRGAAYMARAWLRAAALLAAAALAAAQQQVADLTAALAAGCAPIDAARLANKAAGVVVAKMGTATACPADLLQTKD